MYARWKSYRGMGKLLRYGNDIEIRKSYEDMSKNSDYEYHNKEVKRLEVKVRKTYLLTYSMEQSPS
jgi:hypothetical protein